MKPSRSFTLIETLSVLVLLGLVAGYAVSVLGRDASPVVVAESVLAVDQRARLIARTEGPLIMRIERGDVVLESVDARRAERRYELAGPASLQKPVVYNRFGQSEDYSVRVGPSDGVLTVHGLSGWSQGVERSP